VSIGRGPRLETVGEAIFVEDPSGVGEKIHASSWKASLNLFTSPFQPSMYSWTTRTISS
jgi:hypothetical protein